MRGVGCTMEAQAEFSGRLLQPVQHAIVQQPRCKRRRLRMPHVVTAANVLASPERPAAAPERGTLSLGERVRGDFPILNQEVNGQPLVYLDSGATSQKPTQVMQAMDDYYYRINSNVHRGVHHLAAEATTAYEAARQKVASFVNADSWREIVFTRNASEAVNLVAHAWGTANLKPGDEIIVSVAEHHSVIVPMQMLAQRTGATLRHVGLTPDQRVDLEALKGMLGPKTKLVATVHVSNMLGSVTDVPDLADAVHTVGGKLLVDACQSVPNMPVDVRALGADWLVASSHKMCGPTGIGFLWGRYDALESMQPWMGGGEMIQDVFLDHSTYADPPSRFEAGTPAIAEAIGLGAACDYLAGLGMDHVAAYERQLGTYLYEQLSAVDGVDIYGPPPAAGRAALSSFNVKGLHASDVSTVLDQAGVAVRSGHHCTQPLHRELGINASARASLYLYSTPQDVDRFIVALKDSVAFFREMGL